MLNYTKLSERAIALTCVGLVTLVLSQALANKTETLSINESQVSKTVAQSEP